MPLAFCQNLRLQVKISMKLTDGPFVHQNSFVFYSETAYVCMELQPIFQ